MGGREQKKYLSSLHVDFYFVILLTQEYIFENSENLLLIGSFTDESQFVAIYI